MFQQERDMRHRFDMADPVVKRNRGAQRDLGHIYAKCGERSTQSDRDSKYDYPWLGKKCRVEVCSGGRTKRVPGEGGSLTGVGSHSIGACRVLGSVKNVYLVKRGKFD